MFKQTKPTGFFLHSGCGMASAISLSSLPLKKPHLKSITPATTKYISLNKIKNKIKFYVNSKSLYVPVKIWMSYAMCSSEDSFFCKKKLK